MIGSDIDKHLYPILRLFLFGLGYTCCLAKVKNKTFRATLWSVLMCLRSARGREGRVEAARAQPSAPLAARSARAAARAVGATHSTGLPMKDVSLSEVNHLKGLRDAKALPPVSQAADLAGHTPMQPAPEPQGSLKIFHGNFHGKYLISLKMSACFHFILLDKLNKGNGRDMSRNPENVGEGKAFNLSMRSQYFQLNILD